MIQESFLRAGQIDIFNGYLFRFDSKVLTYSSQFKIFLADNNITLTEDQKNAIFIL